MTSLICLDLKELVSLSAHQPDWDDGLTDDEVLYIPSGKRPELGIQQFIQRQRNNAATYVKAYETRQNAKNVFLPRSQNGVFNTILSTNISGVIFPGTKTFVLTQLECFKYRFII